MSHRVLEEEHVETDPEQIPDEIIDINLDRLKPYFSNDAWMVVEQIG